MSTPTKSGGAAPQSGGGGGGIVIQKNGGPAPQVPVYSPSGTLLQGGTPKMPVYCPVPTIGQVYSAGGQTYVYLPDGLHQFPDMNVFTALGFNVGALVAMDPSCVGTIGTSTPIASDYTTAHSQIVNGMGIQAPAAVAGATNSSTTVSGGAQPAGIIAQAEAGFQAHEKLIVGGVIGFILLRSGVLRGVFGRGGLL